MVYTTILPRRNICKLNGFNMKYQQSKGTDADDTTLNVIMSPIMVYNKRSTGLYSPRQVIRVIGLEMFPVQREKMLVYSCRDLLQDLRLGCKQRNKLGITPWQTKSDFHVVIVVIYTGYNILIN